MPLVHFMHFIKLGLKVFAPVGFSRGKIGYKSLDPESAPDLSKGLAFLPLLLIGYSYLRCVHWKEVPAKILRRRPLAHLLPQTLAFCCSLSDHYE